MSEIGRVLNEIRGLLSEQSGRVKRLRIKDPVLESFVEAALKILESTSKEEPYDWDRLLKAIEGETGQKVKIGHELSLAKALEDLGFTVEKKEGRFERVVPPKGGLSPRRERWGRYDLLRIESPLNTARNAIKDFQKSMEDLLDLLKEDPEEAKLDRKRRFRLQQLLSALEDSVDGAEYVFWKVVGR